ncbi:ABC transporter ATP-binding protein/permease [bacterium]|nr:ABC transporter ATP-binding protein/permease [bacterium]
MFQKGNSLAKSLGLFERAYGAYKKHIAALVLLGFVAGLLEAVGVNAIIPLFAFFSGEESYGSDAVSETIVSLFDFFGTEPSVGLILVLIVLLFILRSAALFCFSYMELYIRTGYERNVREKIFRESLATEWRHLVGERIGHLETLIMTDANRAGVLLKHLAEIIMLATSLLMYAIIAVNISPVVTAFSMLAGIVIFFAFRPLIRRTRMIARKTSALYRAVAEHVNESVVGMKTVKAFGAERPVQSIGQGQFEGLMNNQRRAFVISAIATQFVQPLSIIFVACVFLYAHRTETMSFGALVAVIYLVQRIFSYIQLLQGHIHTLNSLVPYVKNIIEAESLSSAHKESLEGRDSFAFEKHLSFRNVSFAYSPKKTILSDISFSIERGRLLGLIGASGAGKTTIFDLILRLLSPLYGEIALDGKPIRDIDIGEWKKNVGYVSQDMYLVNGSIKDNIRFYGDSISDDDIADAARKAHAYEFIRELPDGFDTVVGGRGMKLSMGQRQRVSIARVLARKPQILLLDEATSALDNESEVRIQETIAGLRGTVTTFVIAHRLSTVMGCDTILVLEGRRIVEEGAPEKLLSDKNSYFYKVYNIRQ